MRSKRSAHICSYRSSKACAHPNAMEVGADDLAAADALLGDQPSPLEDGDVLLHRREAHGVVVGQLGDALMAGHRAAHDVAPRGISQGAEDAVVVEHQLHSYNHTVVRQRCQGRASATVVMRR